MAKLVMGYWDCPVCGNKGVPGNVMNCPSCGRARGDVQFYMKDGLQEATLEAGETGGIEYLNEEQSKDFGKNPDWYCSFCNSLNKDSAAFCSNCGATREASESNYFDQLKKRQEAEAAEKAAQPRPQAKKKSRLPLLIVIALVIVGMVVWFSGNKTQGNLQVTGLSWSRSIPIEQNRQFTESDWSVPAGGTEVSHERAIHHYDQVLDHYKDVEVQRSRQVLDGYETYYTYEDNGNGSFTQVSHERPVYKTEYYTETVSQPVYVSVPRYQTKYTYTIWRWVPSREASASGTDHEAVWPEMNLAEDEREGSPRKEQYGFTVADKDGKASAWTLSEEDWRAINIGDGLTIQSPRTGGASWIVDEKGNKLAQVNRN